MEKDIKNTNVVARKLGPVSIRVTNQKLEVAKEKRRKREEMVDRRKTEAMATKRQRTKKELVCSLKRRRIMRVIPEIKQIQTKLTIIKTYCNSEKRGPGDAMNNDLIKCHYIYTRI